MQGFNLDYLKIKQLMDAPECRATLVNELRKLEPNQKVLRYPGGNEGIEFGYEKEVTEFFIQFCKDSGVKEIVLRAYRNDFKGSLEQYLHLSSELEVKQIQFSNEDYFSIRPLNVVDSLLWRVASTRAKVTKQYAENYAIEFLLFDAYLKNQGFNLSTKLIWNTHFKTDAMNKTWHNTLKDKLKSFKKCAIHIYGEFQDTYFEELVSNVKTNFKGLEIYVTEYHGLAFHNLDAETKELYFKSPKAQLMDRQVNEAMTFIGAKYRLKHCLFQFDHYKTYYAEYLLNLRTGKIV